DRVKRRKREVRERCRLVYDFNHGDRSLKLSVFTAFLSALLSLGLPASAQFYWPIYSHDYASTRYSPLNQINTKNVQLLQPAWTYHLKKEGPRPLSAGAVSRGGGRRSS